MENLAVLVGNTEYDTLSTLECCRADVYAMRQLLEATNKYSKVEVFLNTTSARLKDGLRELISNFESIGELFFYFTGHGYQHESEFFFCAPNFDSRRPNETGLSSSDLHSILRSANPDLSVKVIDACNSGKLLLKADGAFMSNDHKGFKNIIQIASCLDSQSSLAGDPLSVFTEKFRAAAVRKTEGVVYYADIVSVLRDEFLDNNSQTPHFISQGTGREQFVENAQNLDPVRQEISESTELVNGVSSALEPRREPTELEILAEAESRFGNRGLAESFIDSLFTGISRKVAEGSLLNQLFDVETIVHANFEESESEPFIAKVLHGKERPDNFVTTHGPNALQLAAQMMLSTRDSDEHYSAKLNCRLPQVQTKLLFTPKSLALAKFALIITCAPSLESCYVFELATKHRLRDWEAYDNNGIEVIRRWYLMGWRDDVDSLVIKIVDQLALTVLAEIKKS